MGSKWNVRYGLGSIWFPWRLGDHREMTVFHMGEVSCSQILGELGGSLRFTLKSLLIQKMPMENSKKLQFISIYGFMVPPLKSLKIRSGKRRVRKMRLQKMLKMPCFVFFVESC
jgi:hypothetical protein